MRWRVFAGGKIIPTLVIFVCSGVALKAVFWLTAGDDAVDDDAADQSSTSWHRAELFPMAPDYVNAYRPPWLDRWGTDADWNALGVSDEARAAARAAATAASSLTCQDMLWSGSRYRVPPKTDAAAHAAGVAAAWVQFEADASRRTTRYCVAQCGSDRCCPSGMVNEDAFEQIYGSRERTLASSRGNGGDGTNNITLVTQGSPDRVETFLKVLTAWEGPAVAMFLVYNQSKDDYEQAAKDRASVEGLVTAIRDRSNVQILLYTVTLRPGMDHYGSRFVVSREARGDEPGDAVIDAESSKLTL